MVTSQTEEKDKAEAEAKTEAEAEEENPDKSGEAEAKVETEEKAEGEEKAKAEAAEESKTEAEEKAKTETEAKPETEAAEEKDKPETEAKVEAEEKTGNQSEAKPETEAAEEPKAEAEEKAKPEVEAEEKAETETEAKTETETVEEKDKPETETKVEAEEKTETEPEAKPETEAAEEPKAEAEKKAKPEVEAKPEAEAIKETDKPEAKTEAEEKAETEEKNMAPDQSQESAKGGVSETIQKMTQSPAFLPGESSPSEERAGSGKPAMGTPQGGNLEHISVPSTICAKDIMQKDVAWADPEESVQQALTKMQQHDSSYIIVGQDGALEGIVSKSDITGATSIYLRPIFAKWHGPGDDATLQIKLKWIMSRPVRTIRPEASLAAIIDNMCRFGGRGLPVADEQGKVHGLVTVFDIFRTLLNTSEDVSAVGKTAEAPALE
jgi:CBS domain-containing protein